MSEFKRHIIKSCGARGSFMGKLVAWYSVARQGVDSWESEHVLRDLSGCGRDMSWGPVVPAYNSGGYLVMTRWRTTGRAALGVRLRKFTIICRYSGYSNSNPKSSYTQESDCAIVKKGCMSLLSMPSYEEPPMCFVGGKGTDVSEVFKTGGIAVMTNKVFYMADSAGSRITLEKGTEPDSRGSELIVCSPRTSSDGWTAGFNFYDLVIFGVELTEEEVNLVIETMINN